MSSKSVIFMNKTHFQTINSVDEEESRGCTYGSTFSSLKRKEEKVDSA